MGNCQGNCMSVTSREIMSELGIKNVKTLTRWHQRGVIPPPSVEKHPGGIGRIACWDDWVLHHCRTVKQLLADGQTLDDIVGVYGTDWDAVGRRYRRRYIFADVSARMDFENQLEAMQEDIEKTLAERLGSLRERLTAVGLPPVTRDIAIRAVDLARAGFNPVLVVMPKQIVVVPDFMLSHYLAAHYDDSEPLLVCPIFGMVKSHMGPSGFPEMPTARPVPKIQRVGAERIVEETFQHRDTWEYDVIRRRRFKTGT